jgi:hypothetical protein
MAVILELQHQRRRLKAKRGFEAWNKRFRESLDERACLEDLSDAMLQTLIQSNEGSSLLLYDLIMGFMRLGKGAKFPDLESRAKMAVMDISLFLLDQLRFEVMRRLDWVENSPVFRIPILDLVEQFAASYEAMKNQTPELLPSHPRYHEYKELFEGDRSVFIRRLIPDAIEAFLERNEGA